MNEIMDELRVSVDELNVNVNVNEVVNARVDEQEQNPRSDEQT